MPYPPNEAGRPTAATHLPYDTYYVQRPPRKFRDRLWLHVTLFLLTVLFTTVVGAGHYLSYISEFSRRPVALSWSSLLDGLWYSLTLLGILGCHEFGHY